MQRTLINRKVDKFGQNKIPGSYSIHTYHLS
jgi:hypothetical protein